MQKAETGQIVKVHYTGKFTNDTIFDTSANREPLEFPLGQGMMIKGFEEAVLGMTVGEKKVANIAAQDAYGEVRQDMFFEVPTQQFPENVTPEVGMQVQAQTAEGQDVTVVVSAIKEGSVVLDANHPLAGKDLIFEIQLIDIQTPDQASKKPFFYD